MSFSTINFNNLRFDRYISSKLSIYKQQLTHCNLISKQAIQALWLIYIYIFFISKRCRLIWTSSNSSIEIIRQLCSSKPFLTPACHMYIHSKITGSRRPGIFHLKNWIGKARIRRKNTAWHLRSRFSRPCVNINLFIRHIECEMAEPRVSMTVMRGREGVWDYEE